VGFAGSEGVARYLFFLQAAAGMTKRKKASFSDPGPSYASDKKIDTFSEGRH